MSEECIYCGIGKIIGERIPIHNRTAQDSGYRYQCDNEECGLRFRFDPTNNNKIIIRASSYVH